MKNYLKDRQQAVVIEGTESDKLHSGPMSVVQGSVLSCLLYLIYVMDLPLVFQDKRLSTQEEELTREPKSTTYVDDMTTTITMKKEMNYQLQIDNTMNKLTDYMN